MSENQTVTQSSQTRTSLLERMADPAQRNDAWLLFVRRYARLIYVWCEHWGINPTTHEDVLQETMLRVLNSINFFDRQRSGSFRLWLKNLAHSSWVELKRKQDRQLPQYSIDPNNEKVWALLISSKAEAHLSQLCDAWATQELLDLAALRISKRVSSETWQTYVEIVINNRSVTEIQQEFQLTTEQIYNRIFRVKKLLKEEYESLDATQS